MWWTKKKVITWFHYFTVKTEKLRIMFFNWSHNFFYQDLLVSSLVKSLAKKAKVEQVQTSEKEIRIAIHPIGESTASQSTTTKWSSVLCSCQYMAVIVTWCYCFWVWEWCVPTELWSALRTAPLRLFWTLFPNETTHKSDVWKNPQLRNFKYKEYQEKLSS